MGPMLLFDKSFLESLNVDEAAILDQMFSCVISPLFFAETLGDLAKDKDARRDPRKLVGDLSIKTPVAHSYMNSFHTRIATEELLGRPVPMDGRPMVAGGIPVETEDGLGIVQKRSPEVLAFERWQAGRFLDVEGIAAQLWRRSLGELDLPGIAAGFRSMLKKEERPKSQEHALKIANGIIDAQGQNYRNLNLALALLNLPREAHRDIISKWKKGGARSLGEHAPFVAHCMRVDLYFYLCISNGIISDQRASNKIDMGYLYYAPFANAFVSWDKLHRSHVPMFLDSSQQFIWGPDLKADLKALNEYFLALPEAERAQGLFTLASNPPVDHQGLCAQVWDYFRKGWREPKPPSPKISPELKEKILGQSKSMIAAADMGRMPPPPIFGDAFGEGAFDRLSIERAIPKVRGSWRMFSEEVEAAEDARRYRDQ